MGSDQSTTLHPHVLGMGLKSQRDEDIPYTSYSINKPIDGGSPRSSPRSQKHKTPGSFSTDPGSSTPIQDIVVVADGTTPKKVVDPELIKLNAIPTFMPIIKASLTAASSARDQELLDRLDHTQLLQLCTRYQEHLRQLSEAVAFDQNALCVRIKETDVMIQRLMQQMAERQRRYAKFVEHFIKIGETNHALIRIRNNIDNILPMMDRLNSMLPLDLQMEQPSFKVQ